MCVCEVKSSTMTAALPAVWSTAIESAASESHVRMDNPDEGKEKSCDNKITGLHDELQVKLPSESFTATDKIPCNFTASDGAVNEDEGLICISKIDSESLDLRKTSPSEAVANLTSYIVNKETENGSKTSKFPKNNSVSTTKIRNGSPSSPSSSGDEEEYFKPLKKLRMLPSITQSPKSEKAVLDGQLHDQQPVSSSSRVKSFSITDILRHSSNPAAGVSPNTEDKHLPHFVTSSNPSRIVRPWDTDEENNEDYEDEMSISSASSSAESPRPASSGSQISDSLSKHHQEGNPLDALFQMTSKTFEGLKKGANADGSGNPLLFSAKQNSKKKRKSRTAFSNHQIFELEKRFLYQKYLSPADRDELALTLGLTNAQVITWFQNRRAKLKRDMEELKKDVHTATLLGDHTAFIKTMTQMGLLKTKPVDLFSCRK